jgi:hypothetical protein
MAENESLDLNSPYAMQWKDWKAIVAECRQLGFRWASLLDRAIVPVGPGVSHAIA